MRVVEILTGKKAFRRVLGHGLSSDHFPHVHRMDQMAVSLRSWLPICQDPFSSLKLYIRLFQSCSGSIYRHHTGSVRKTDFIV